MASIDDDEITGKKEGERFKLEDIQSIQVKEATLFGKAAGATTAFTLGALEVAILFAIVSALMVGI